MEITKAAALSGAFFIILATFVSIPSVRVFAEDQGEINEPNGSAASFDKRLPPVIPGEEISDGKHTIKVWSTSGDVHGLEAPPTPYIPSTVNIIVDDRHHSNDRHGSNQDDQSEPATH